MRLRAAVSWPRRRVVHCRGGQCSLQVTKLAVTSGVIVLPNYTLAQQIVSICERGRQELVLALPGRGADVRL